MERMEKNLVTNHVGKVYLMDDKEFLQSNREALQSRTVLIMTVRWYLTPDSGRHVQSCDIVTSLLDLQRSHSRTTQLSCKMTANGSSSLSLS